MFLVPIIIHIHGPLFLENKVLKFDELYKAEVGKFVYAAVSNYLLAPLVSAHTCIHNHGTRQCNDLHFKKRYSNAAHNSLLPKASRSSNPFRVPYIRYTASI